MGELIYAMRFKGRAAPVAAAQNVLRATTTAASCSIRSVVGPEGLDGSIGPMPGEEAVFESTVTFTGETQFQESGTIAFGRKNVVRFSTVGQGYFGPGPSAKLSHGSVMWRVDGGSGQFEGATGLITSNFTVTDAGEVTDHHFGVIFVK